MELEKNYKFNSIICNTIINFFSLFYHNFLDFLYDGHILYIKYLILVSMDKIINKIGGNSESFNYR
ncbi:MAG: hypothetical protein A2086_14510 [Spirochaetes bacterium GWD1_27_9]|nr:MAG: hypothetical protein A2Z98_18635 [Spirochaetes bacterium GWB1_27_13]OHD20239.1 MAG: hypothetical protein A2Y34_04875 [Spirochaetes bacterium GWC1_27_15]OHD42575.1 MAG: hypothetical protein A2086_14510 [Spirochaetes bacterium GWD1_27_9]